MSQSGPPKLAPYRGIEDVARANQRRLKADRSERVEKKIAEHKEFMRDDDLKE